MTRLAPLALVFAVVACSPEAGPEVGSQTNWLIVCDSSAECGDLECTCGACTASCESDADCEGLDGASCVAAGNEGSTALCGGRAAQGGVCLPRCEQSCEDGTSCVAGVCVPTRIPTARLTVDPDLPEQTLVGFGASITYTEDAIASHPDRAALYDLAFDDAGLDVLRMGNRFDATPTAELQSPREIVSEASVRLGRAPVLFMTSGSPPATLKANGVRMCGGDPETCTLAALPSGSFDYAAFARHWRDSLEAYADADLAPDYVGIQNNPDWAPPEDNPNDACRFLPEEGTTTVTVDGAEVEVAYPGYREALAAVRAAIADLPIEPRFAAPETSHLATV
jgi:hypothetical protein